MTQNQSAAEQARTSPTGTESQWATALANLRDTLQDAGVPVETTDNLVIRHTCGLTTVRDLTDGREVMEVESPSALQAAKYGLAWAYSLGRPRPTFVMLPAAKRASLRATAAV